ncbi:MAG: hypothetical protein OXN84_00790, partial [Albidovulum sp.]|nr:hypothetical protein [Albidovulum sp.]
RFGPDVPVETIPLDNPEAEAITESERELVGEKTVHRLAQTPSSFKIIRYVLRTWKHRRFAAGRPESHLHRRELPRGDDGGQVLPAPFHTTGSASGWRRRGSA